jgi:ELWxxDGT repeat protein
VHGSELWKFDTIGKSVTMVDDIYSGFMSSDPSNITVANGLLYFSATDGNDGRELWVSDGVNPSVEIGNFNQNGDFFPYMSSYMIQTAF